MEKGITFEQPKKERRITFDKARQEERSIMEGESRMGGVDTLYKFFTERAIQAAHKAAEEGQINRQMEQFGQEERLQAQSDTMQDWKHRGKAV